MDALSAPYCAIARGYLSGFLKRTSASPMANNSLYFQMVTGQGYTLGKEGAGELRKGTKKKGVFSKGGFCRVVERHAQGKYKNTQGYWAQLYIWHSERDNSCKNPLLPGISK